MNYTRKEIINSWKKGDKKTLSVDQLQKYNQMKLEFKELFKKYGHKFPWKESWEKATSIEDLSEEVEAYLKKAGQKHPVLARGLAGKFSKRLVAIMTKILNKTDEVTPVEKKNAVSMIRTISKTLVPTKTEELREKIQKVESAPAGKAVQLIQSTTEAVKKESAKVQKKAEVILKKVKAHSVGKTYPQQEAKTKKIKVKKPGSASCRYVRVYTIGGVRTSKSTSKKISVEDFKKLQAIIKETKKNK